MPSGMALVTSAPCTGKENGVQHQIGFEDGEIGNSFMENLPKLSEHLRSSTAGPSRDMCAHFCELIWLGDGSGCDVSVFQQCFPLPSGNRRGQ